MVVLLFDKLKNHLDQELQGRAVPERILNYRMVSQKNRHFNENNSKTCFYISWKHAFKRAISLNLLPQK